MYPQGETLSRVVSTRIAAAAASTAAITALVPEQCPDGALVQVLAGQLFHYDAASVAAGSATVLVPDDARTPGRWIANSLTNAALALTTAGNGASLIGIQDAGLFTASTTVETALAEIYQDLESTTGRIPIALQNHMLADGSPAAKWADNAGASAPGTTLADAKAVGVRWNNWATQTAIWTSCSCPSDMDLAKAPKIKIKASKTGATLGDAVTFDVVVYEQALAALHDAGASLGGTTNAMTGDATAKTVQEVSFTLTAPSTALSVLSVSVKPTNGTLGTDDVIIEAMWLEYSRKLRTS